jgi:hypothetical protein
LLGGEVLPDQIRRVDRPLTGDVVLRQARGWRPRRPAARISRQMRLGETRTPRAASSAQTRRTP